MKFVLMVGIPGSGKSTVAAGLIDQGYVCFNADIIRQELYGDAKTQGDHQEVFGVMYERMEEAMCDEKDIVIDNTNVRKYNRRMLIALAKQWGYEVEIWLVDTPLEECLERNAKRERVVPEDVIVKMHETLEQNRPLLRNEGKLITVITTSPAS